MNTDLHSHHIEGMLPDGRNISIPLISHINGNLWTGGCISGVKLPDDFRYVVSLYPWEQYELPDGCSRLEARLYDSAQLPNEIQLHTLAQIVQCMLVEGKTLVHCQAGLNRSNLIAGLTLIHMGMTARTAIDMIRVRRSDLALCNKTFERWLLAQDEGEARVA